MVGRVEAPKESYFMPKIVIDITAQFPYYILINKPIPSIGGFKERIFLKETYEPNNGSQRQYSPNYPIKNNDDKVYPISFQLLSFPKKDNKKFYKQ
jgi:hypothetical protein